MLIVVSRTRADVRTVEVQVIRAAANVRRRGPIVPGAATTDHPGTITEPGVNKVIWEGTPIFRALGRSVVGHLGIEIVKSASGIASTGIFAIWKMPTSRTKIAIYTTRGFTISTITSSSGIPVVVVAVTVPLGGGSVGIVTWDKVGI